MRQDEGTIRLAEGPQGVLRPGLPPPPVPGVWPWPLPAPTAPEPGRPLRLPPGLDEPGRALWRDQLGRDGEALAARWLKALGWRVLRQGYRAGRAEVDLILWRDPDLVFCEVKTRGSRPLARPERAAGRAKWDLYREAQQAWQDEHPRSPAPRYDLIAIEYLEGGYRILHLTGL